MWDLENTFWDGITFLSPCSLNLWDLPNLVEGVLGMSKSVRFLILGDYSHCGRCPLRLCMAG